MFLDDELEEVYKKKGCDPIMASGTLFATCVKRMLDPEKNSVEDCISQWRRIDNGWRLFCKKHPELSPDGFKDVLIEEGLPTSIRMALKL